MVILLSFTKKVFALVLRFALIVFILLGLTYVDRAVAVLPQSLIYVLYGALLIIGIWFRKQKAVLLVVLYLLLLLPQHVPELLGGVVFDRDLVSSGIVLLVAVNTLLLGLFEEGQLRLGSFLSFFLVILIQVVSLFALAHYVGEGAMNRPDSGVFFHLPSVQIGGLSQEVSFILLVCLVGGLVKELLVPTPFARLSSNLVWSLGIYHYLAEGFGVALDSLFLVWGLLTAFYIFQRMYQVSYIDPLTGIPSRRALFEQANTLTGNYTVAMADIDFFKKFNDKYGHDVGDDVLAFVASILNKEAHGAVFRHGGEEFVLVFRKSSLDETVKHLDEVRKQVAKSKFKLRRKIAKGTGKASEVTVTISIGVAEHGDKHQSFSDVLKAADKALYRAKKKGRNCVSK